MDAAGVLQEFDLARAEFRETFGVEAKTAAAPGWQANANSRNAYDRAGMLYASDTRGTEPYFVRENGRAFATLEIPSTLPTLDELLGRPEYPDAQIVPHLLSLLQADRLNVFTLHAELEGMGKRAFFVELLAALKKSGVTFLTLEQAARECLARRDRIPVCEMLQGPIDGRSGLLAVQGPRVTGN
jgi:undecaprenyl phosphate-alpha-L-ara4FN deformylase